MFQLNPINFGSTYKFTHYTFLNDFAFPNPPKSGENTEKLLPFRSFLVLHILQSQFLKYNLFAHIFFFLVLWVLVVPKLFLG